jgi:hypothetical protein
MEEPREPSRRIVAHHELDVVASAPERRRLMLGVLDDSARI